MTDPRRALIAVVVTAVVVATVVGLAVGLLLVSGPTVGSGCITLGRNVTMSAPVSATIGTHHWYNYTVLRVTETPSPSDMASEASNPAGTPLFPFPWAIVFVHPGSTEPFATYDVSTPGWSYGSTVSLDRGYVLSVDVGTSAVAGYTLVALGQTDFSGTLNLPLS